VTAVSDDRSHSLTATQATASTAKMRNTMIPWCSSALRNAVTSVGLLVFSPEFMPGMACSASASAGYVAGERRDAAAPGGQLVRWQVRGALRGVVGLR